MENSERDGNTRTPDLPLEKPICRSRSMPADKVVHYNRIDIGIFLCFLELCMMQSDVFYERELFTDTAESDCEEVLTAKYRLN